MAIIAVPRRVAAHKLGRKRVWYQFTILCMIRMDIPGQEVRTENLKSGARDSRYLSDCAVTCPARGHILRKPWRTFLAWASLPVPWEYLHLPLFLTFLSSYFNFWFPYGFKYFSCCFGPLFFLQKLSVFAFSECRFLDNFIIFSSFIFS